MTSRKQQDTQKLAVAKAGISERSGREIESGRRKSQPKSHDWATRKDPFAAVWDSELVPMLEQQPLLTAITLLEYLQTKYPGEYPDSKLRTLQRRVKKWLALHGPEKEVIFRQTHEPGQQGLSDFTILKGITVTVAGQPLNHMLYHFRLAFSHWSYMRVTLGGESFTALAEGLQEALCRLNGSPKEHRTDSLSAAYKNLAKEEQDDLTCRYESICSHYTMTATRNNPGASHENGSIESAHGHLKRRIEQALLLRNSYDFDSVEDYQLFIEGVVASHNKRNAKLLSEERLHLSPLPKDKAADYELCSAVVTSSGTVSIKRVTYSVDSRLMGETLQVRVYDNRLLCYLGTQFVMELKRIYAPRGNMRVRQIDYRHMIHSLIKKPQAFYHSLHKEDLLPNDQFKAIWSYIDKNMPKACACRFIVNALYLAASQNCEEEIACWIQEKINAKVELSLSQMQSKFAPEPESVPLIDVQQHNLQGYDLLISANESTKEIHHDQQVC